MLTELVSSAENHNIAHKTTDFNKFEDDLELMNQETLELLWKREIRALEEKLQNFRQDFITQFYGYTPEFLSDMIYIKNIKNKENSKS